LTRQQQALKQSPIGIHSKSVFAAPTGLLWLLEKKSGDTVLITILFHGGDIAF
jgi:hypothetical protein